MPRHKFLWEPVADRARLRDTELGRFSTAFSVPTSHLAKGIRSSIEIAGIPTVPGATPRDEALIFLEAAAELEHALSIEYLFAGFSCQAPDLREDLTLIARQEMGHLISVQNLRLFCGGTPYLARQDQDAQPEIDPFPFALDVVSLDALAKYAVCEMPAESSIPSGLLQMVSEIRLRAEGSVGSLVHRVGALYAKIYWLFMPDDTHVGPWVDFPADLFAGKQPGQHITVFPGGGSAEAYQADSAEWQIGGGDIIIQTCPDRNAALVLLNDIAAQGEGLSNTADSHFEMFVRAYQRGKSDGIRVHPVPSQPTTDAGARPGTLISHPVSAKVARLCDAIYVLLQTEILLSLTFDKRADSDGLRAALISLSLDGMRDVRWSANQLVTRLPLTNSPGETQRAAPTFMPVGTIEGSRANLLAAYEVGINALEAILGQLGGEPALDAIIRARLPILTSKVATRKSLASRIRNAP